MSDKPETPPATEPVIRTVAMPADTNPSGDIFGGWLMSQMDLAAGTLASLRSRGRSATIAVDAMIFHRPVKVGDEVSLYARQIRVGRTSMKIHVEAWRRRREAMESNRVTEATFTFVALDTSGQPRPVPPDHPDLPNVGHVPADAPADEAPDAPAGASADVPGDVLSAAAPEEPSR